MCPGLRKLFFFVLIVLPIFACSSAPAPETSSSTAVAGFADATIIDYQGAVFSGSKSKDLIVAALKGSPVVEQLGEYKKQYAVVFFIDNQDIAKVAKTINNIAPDVLSHDFAQRFRRSIIINNKEKSLQPYLERCATAIQKEKFTDYQLQDFWWVKLSRDAKGQNSVNRVIAIWSVPQSAVQSKIDAILVSEFSKETAPSPTELGAYKELRKNFSQLF